MVFKCKVTNEKVPFEITGSHAVKYWTFDNKTGFSGFTML
jgi:hypothetical protein